MIKIKDQGEIVRCYQAGAKISDISAVYPQYTTNQIRGTIYRRGIGRERTWSEDEKTKLRNAFQEYRRTHKSMLYFCVYVSSHILPRRTYDAVRYQYRQMLIKKEL